MILADRHSFPGLEVPVPPLDVGNALLSREKSLRVLGHERNKSDTGQGLRRSVSLRGEKMKGLVRKGSTRLKEAVKGK